MKTLKILLFALFPLFLLSCSQDIMDEINKEKNNALEMSVQSMLPDVILKAAVEAAATDIAWYSSVYIEQSAGTWAQSYDQDRRVGQTAATLFNNEWNNLYDAMNILKDMIRLTGPEGTEENGFARGVAQILTAYNLAMATDLWGEVPWTEALLGSENLQPVYDKQSTIYPKVQQLLSDGIATLQSATNVSGAGDYIYNGDVDKWIMAANSLKARFALRLTNVDNNAAGTALGYVSSGFASADDALVFDAYEATAIGENPWFQFFNDRSHLSIGKTLYDLMDARNDPRMAGWFEALNDTIRPAPNGEAVQTQGGVYSQSLITANGRTAPTPIMTYHELKFIEAEAKFRTGNGTWQAALQEAIEANFVYHGWDAADGTAYFTNEVSPLLAGNELNEILTQKYIACFEYESIEAYNDYRRVPSFLTLHNPANQTTGFVWRFPYPTSEEASNSANIPDIDVFTDKVWWAGGTEN